MTRPFQYDNFVQSQIAIGNSNSKIQFGSGVHRNQDRGRNPLTETSRSYQSRLSLKNKIDELLGLCRDENNGIKNQFKQVIGAEKEILDLMKEQLDQPPRFNNYAQSNVEMFPGTSQYGSYGPVPPYQDYGDNPQHRNHQTFPLHGRNYHENQNYQLQFHPQQYQSQPYQQSQAPYGTYGRNQTHVADYGYASGYKPRSVFVNQENRGLRNTLSQPRFPIQDDDLQIRQLQQEVLRLRDIVQDYENQITALNSNPANSEKVSLLRQLKAQGERIRQDTLALLRGKIAPGNENLGYPTNRVYASGNYGYSRSPQLISSQHQGVNGLTPQQQAQFRAQLNELRRECQQLQQENATIKRISKQRSPNYRRY